MNKRKKRAATISFGIQKGGVGKSTTAGITAFLLSKDYKVLAVDFDSQGNLTQLLTQRNIYDFSSKTVLEACKEKNPEPYIIELTDSLHMLPSEDLLATFSRYLYQSYHGSKAHLLKETLESIKDNYDFIIIDLPPNLGDQTINGLTASDFAVVMLQSEPFCYDAVNRYLETLQLVKERTNPDLILAGILTTMMDIRTTIDGAILDQARENYEDVVFDTVIRRKNRIKEFSIMGITDKNRVDREALKTYKNFTKELVKRVKEG